MVRADFYVYVLFRPWNGEPCCVGKGSGSRIDDHLRMGSHPNSHLRSIIKRAAGDLPRVMLHSDLAEEVAFAYERALIAAIGRSDLGIGPLTNRADGGEGSAGHKWTDDARAAKAIEVARRWEDPTYREKMRTVNVGNTWNCGRRHTEESRKKRGDARSGTKLSDETRAAISKANIGVPKNLSAEARSKLSATVSAFQRGRTKSPEHREKIRQSNIATKASRKAARLEGRVT